MNEEILLQVQKPARYIGQEWNVSRKDFDRARIRFAICFPDLYEVGMSNLGIRIIYGLLNQQEDVICERFFSPGTDLESLIRGGKTGYFSLESKRKLQEFDIVGFSLASELDYTNVLNILDLGGIPLKASQRDKGYPLVIGGGPCALNPEPMHAFFDLFVIGEAEDAILEILDIYRKSKSSKISKQELLLRLVQVEGVYVPSFYEVQYSDAGTLQKFEPIIKGVPAKIHKRIVRDFDSSFFPVDWLVPYIQTVHDRITLEIMRGCPNRCRFCQARSGYYPYRFRKVENILNLARECYQRTGYEEISLCGLSVSDYPYLEGLLKGLMDSFKERAVSLSLPSVKPQAILGGVSALIATVKKTGLTFAPEAGSERLRKVIAKDFDEQDFFNTLQQAYASGYQRVKLYFMIGLPGEEEKDLESVVEMAVKVSELRREIKKVPAYVNISINTLIPKPHTPFQWLGMEEEGRIKTKQDFLMNKKRNKRLVWNFHNRDMSLLEGVLARGDRRLSNVICRAFEKGARFDAWSHYFIFDFWKQAFQESGSEASFYLQKKAPEEILPWDFIEVGVSKECLLQEFNKTIAIK
ncbi:MAG: TIGR03960 family B12-binding radical SAM protein [Candidatus Omnitrophota bacterium]